jgi:hypothetical protein
MDTKPTEAVNFVCRDWQVAFLYVQDTDTMNKLCAQARTQLLACSEISKAEIAMLKMKYPHLTTYDK